MVQMYKPFDECDRSVSSVSLPSATLERRLLEEFDAVLQSKGRTFDATPDSNGVYTCALSNESEAQEDFKERFAVSPSSEQMFAIYDMRKPSDVVDYEKSLFSNVHYLILENTGDFK